MLDIKNLNPQQKEAVLYEGGSLLVLAGAGSGKTKVLTYRAANMISSGKIGNKNVLLLTFTNHASHEMKNRIKELLAASAETADFTPYAGTFHSFCVKLLRIDGEKIGIDKSFVIYDESDKKEAVKDILEKFNLSTDSYNPGSIANQISEAKNQMITPLQYSEFAKSEFDQVVFKVYNEYQKYLSDSQSLDFDDLLTKGVQLLQDVPEVLNKWQNNLFHIFVDEWQDTNKIQYKLAKLLVGENENITAVGDASQSIYSWRGADYKNINYLSKDYPKIKIINLEQNYRSTQVILDAANSVISKNTNHPILKLWTQNGQGERIKMFRARNGFDEATFVVEEIQKLKRQGFDYTSIAILYRTNAQSRVLEEALIHQAIPYTLVGGVKFYDRKEVKDIISYLRLLSNPKDKVSTKRSEKIGKKKHEKFLEFSQSLGGDLSTYTTLEIMDAMLAKIEYLKLFEKESEENLQRLENIKELRSVALQFPILAEFLESVALVEAEQNSKGNLVLTTNNEHDKITLMTLHAAKGLEFPVVFMVGMEEGIFPHSRSLFDSSQLEEERRLAYVGITRAKEILYLTFAGNRLFFGQKTSNPPSRFLIDIPQELIDSEDGAYRVTNGDYY
ncbi:MAG: UvrD-helicase domain-containing protein [Patescibacteria group bacterium]